MRQDSATRSRAAEGQIVLSEHDPDPPPSLDGYPLTFVDVADGFGVYRLADPDAPLEALRDEEFEQAEARIPYFAALWPSGEALARHLLAGPALDGRVMLDLGCGVGVVGLAAAWRGARVHLVDHEPRAIALASLSAARLGLTGIEGHVADWRALPPLPPFDLVLGADVLYEEGAPERVADVLATLLPPGGQAWIADPGRAGLDRFLALLEGQGLHLLETRPLPATAAGVATRLLVVQRVA
jgi:predicted nicotinamide N-methyase